MKVMIFSLLGFGFALFSCGSDEKTTTPEPAATKTPTTDTDVALTYADVSSIISSDCGGCHPGASSKDFSTLAKIKSFGAAEVARALGVTMPQGKATGYKDTTNGAKLHKWLTTGSDLK